MVLGRFAGGPKCLLPRVYWDSAGNFEDSGSNEGRLIGFLVHHTRTDAVRPSESLMCPILLSTSGMFFFSDVCTWQSIDSNEPKPRTARMGKAVD
jgi:hypothetical protein